LTQCFPATQNCQDEGATFSLIGNQPFLDIVNMLNKDEVDREAVEKSIEKMSQNNAGDLSIGHQDSS